MQDSSPFSGDQAAQIVARRVASLTGGRQAPIIGINGAQGSGKSTIAQSVAEALAREHGLSCAILSLDDFYLTRAEREELAGRVHPLCTTRGVPGTHDVPLMRRTLESLVAAGPDSITPLPRFDKLADDRSDRVDWGEWRGRPDLVLLEGWCVGIRGTDLPAWAGPLNALEKEHDPNGEWFAWSLSQLPRYEPVWDLLALLVSIEVPDLETVIESRLRQERGLAAASDRPAMDRQAVKRFVEHYERYTCALWAAMRRRADILLRRDAGFAFTLAS